MSNLNVMTGHPFRGENLRNLKIFLKRMGIIYDDNIEYSICLLDGNCRIVGSGSVETDVIKCVAIDRGYQGRGLMSVMISELIHTCVSECKTTTCIGQIWCKKTTHFY